MDHVSQTNRASADPEGHAQAMADAEAEHDETPGPDHWTREDIDAIVGAVFSIAENLAVIMEGVASATKQSAPKAGG